MNFKSIVSIILFTLLLIVAFQNMANISIQILFWEVRAPQLLILPTVFLLGMLVGMLLARQSKRKEPSHGEERGKRKEGASQPDSRQF
ncbi:MAG: lipopolysaccharide assembly protein LapA domain-containing protein [Ignavibacteria bacterium]|nr:lipopolysaccharide assembly protein LapA domain-containing protein [Ignavibacteria bacterium]